ncbi:MAG: pyridoxal-phosphate dependent enzyme [Methylococcales bacterium]|nr:pyridoxal-phosphate dependent enzyme [Methylococcales bacterium]
MTDSLHPHLQLLQNQFAASPLVRLNDERLNRYRVELWLKRDELLHPVISGNKWRKLKYILDHALRRDADCIVSMGGAYSNHLHALAFAGKALQIKTIGYVRGEAPTRMNPTLQDLQDWNMELRFVSRQDYQQLRNYKQHDSLPGLTPGQYWLPEGGSTGLALQGVAETLAEIAIDFDVLAMACGTGATLAGFISAAPADSRILGIAALKNADFLTADVRQLLDSQSIPGANWEIAQDYHFGGFAKTTPALLAFMQQFYTRHEIALEPVYTGKLLFGVYDLLKQGYFRPGQRIVIYHSGGLQGNRTT